MNYNIKAIAGFEEEKIVHVYIENSGVYFHCNSGLPPYLKDHYYEFSLIFARSYLKILSLKIKCYPYNSWDDCIFKIIPC